MAEPDTGHLSDRELAGLLDDDLPFAERERVISHLDQCAACRRELGEMQQVVDSYAARQPAPPGATPLVTRSPSRRRWPLVASAGALAAAAVVVAVLVMPRSGSNDDAGVQRVRGAPVLAPDEGRQRITVIGPPESATVFAASTVFSWRSTGADVYRFTLLSERGEPVWSHETADTTVHVPRTVAPAQPGTYFWRVDAIADGIAATTGARIVRLSR